MTTERATVAATQDTAALEYAEHLRRLVDTFPPLTEAQRDRLAALLRPPSTAPDRRHARREPSCAAKRGAATS